MTKRPAMSLPFVRSHDRTFLALTVCAAALATAPVWAQDSQTQQQPSQTQTPPQSQTTPSKPSTETAATPEQTPQTQPDPAQQETVTIVGQKPAVQKKIDRDVYDVKQDPQAATGNAADVMNNVPQVTVDGDGTVALRGNTNVQVYVNGKPAAQMQGDNRAATLQSMAADDIDSIEVMTNPSSAFGSDSGGGIINIVLKKNRRLTPAANMNLTYGSEGRGGLNLSGSRTVGKFGFSGSLGTNHWVRKSESDSVRIQNPDTASEQESIRHGVNSGETDNLQARGQVDYALTEYSNLSAELNLSRGTDEGYSIDETKEVDSAGNVTRDSANVSRNTSERTSPSLVFSYDWRSKDIDGETFRSQLRHSETNSERTRDQEMIQHQPARPVQMQRFITETNTTVDGFSGDWVRPLANQAQLTAGWDITRTEDESYNFQSAIDAVDTPNPLRTNTFTFERTVSAAYLTYQKMVGKWGVLGGLRVEAVHEDSLSQDILPATADLENSRDYVNWSPSLFVTYDLAEDRKLKGTYSHKVNRPQGNVLNPFIVYVDDQNVRSGNPDLKPEEVDTFELEYDKSGKGLNYSIEGYYKSTDNAATYASIYLPTQPDVLWTTTINSDSRRETGVELSLSRNEPNQKFSYNLNGSFGYSEQDTLDVASGQPIRRAGPTSSARARFNYKPKSGVNYTLMIRSQGEAPTSQGYRSGFVTVDMNYSRDLTPKLRLNIMGRNLLDSDTRRTFTETSIIRSESESRQMGPTFMMSLNYRFGNTPNRDGDRQQWRMREGGQGGPGGPGGGGFGGGPGGGL